MGRPLTQRELKKQKSSKVQEPRLTVTNMNRKRSITLQVRDGDSDFYVGERAIYIAPGKSYTDRTSVFNEDQISNLKAKGEIRVLTANI